MKLHVAHILVTHQYEAEDLLKKLKDGAAFEDLAKKHSHCPSAPHGGDLGALDPRRLDPDFAEIAESLSPGEISKTVRTRFGYHLIKKLK